MEYTVNKLSHLAGVSTRTLRYYHEIGLLVPGKINESGYRIYGETEVDRLQQILFYKELGLELDTIKTIMADTAFDREEALTSHLEALLKKREQINRLIANVSKTIAAMKGDTTMTDKEKFEGFKTKLVNENEKQYGQEIRAKYGDKQVEAANQKLMQSTKEQYQTINELEEEIKHKLKMAFETGNPAGDLAQEVCELHKQWISYYWPEGTYSKEAHKGLAQSYVDDSRFKAYYDKIQEGCAEFLRDAIFIFGNN